MKHLHIYVLSLVGLLTAQCSSDDNGFAPQERPDWNVDNSWQCQRPTWTAADDQDKTTIDWSMKLNGNDDSPEWTAPDMSLYPTSMTAIVRLSPVLETFAAEGDKMAAFIGNECRGIGKTVDVNGAKLYFIQIKADMGETRAVVLRYFSESQCRLYHSEDIAFEPDKIYGTAENPEYPDFESSGAYPYIGKAYVTLDNPPFEISPDDKIAAFGDDGECRSIRSRESTDNVYCLHLLCKYQSEELTFKYYSADTKKTYRAIQHFAMQESGNEYGSLSNPQKLSLIREDGMTGYIALDESLAKYSDKDDILAAFSGEECMGTAEQLDNNLYRINISSNMKADELISLRYYSSKFGAVYSLEQYGTFSPNTQYYSEESPYIAIFDYTGATPLKMKAHIRVVTEPGVETTSADLLAAFVGNECRGTGAAVTLSDGTVGYEMEIYGRIGSKETVSLKYYSTKTKIVYHSSATFPFTEGVTIGSEYESKTYKFVP